MFSYVINTKKNGTPDSQPLFNNFLPNQLYLKGVVKIINLSKRKKNNDDDDDEENEKNVENEREKCHY